MTVNIKFKISPWLDRGGAGISCLPAGRGWWSVTGLAAREREQCSGGRPADKINTRSRQPVSSFPRGPAQCSTRPLVTQHQGLQVRAAAAPCSHARPAGAQHRSHTRAAIVAARLSQARGITPICSAFITPSSAEIVGVKWYRVISQSGCPWIHDDTFQYLFSLLQS